MQLVWHRDDLRIHDHPGLAAAVSEGPTVGLVILDAGAQASSVRPRDAFFLQCVSALRDQYRDRGSTVLVRSGKVQDVLPAVVRELGDVEAVHILAAVAPSDRRDEDVAGRTLTSVGVPLRLYPGAYVHPPGVVRTAADTFYTVFAPYFRRWRAVGAATPLTPPGRIPTPGNLEHVEPGAVPAPRTGVQLPAAGETAALHALEMFVSERLADYPRQRDRLDGRGTSHLSPWLAVGALSARTAAARAEDGPERGPAAEKWLSELAWRDFLADLLYHRPHLLESPFDPRWHALEWPGGEERFAAWRDGRTGVAAVDAAMRQLARTGWISNRARMVAAQFLAKNLRVDWRRGAALFERRLVDADTASNTGNWQWAAGLGIDNAPYFRVMNPNSQARTHDPDGEWVRRWAPDSAGADARLKPIVDLAASRAAYIEAARTAHSSGPPV